MLGEGGSTNEGAPRGDSWERGIPGVDTMSGTGVCVPESRFPILYSPYVTDIYGSEERIRNDIGTSHTYII